MDLKRVRHKYRERVGLNEKGEESEGDCAKTFTRGRRAWTAGTYESRDGETGLKKKRENKHLVWTVE